MNESKPDQPGPSLRLLGLRLGAAFLLFVGAIAVSQALRIGQSAGYSVVGPRFFPLVVSFGLLGLGMIFLLRTTLWPDLELAQEVSQEEATTHWLTVIWLLLALVVYAFLLGPMGYTLATALFFPVVARVLGSRQPLRDLIIGLTLGLVVYLVFTRVLGVRLPAGLLQGIL